MTPNSLADHGINLRSTRPGTHRLPCPKCAQAKSRAADGALAVTIDDRGSTWLCHRCGFRGAVNRDEDHADRIRTAIDLTKRPDPTPDQQAIRNQERALDLWRRTEVITPRTPAWAYLTRERGIARWNHDRVRWLASCPFGRERAPALIAPVQGPTVHTVVAIWRVRLDGHGRKVGRFGLGPVKGGQGRVTHWDGGPLALAEGVEDALAVTELTGVPAWACLSADNMTEAVLPPVIREVLIYADVDANEKGRRSAHDLAARLRSEGRAVRVLRAIAGKDPNDVLRARGACQ